MSYVTKIIDRFGGIRKAGRALSLAESTVRRWKTSGSIPDWHKPHVMRTGNALGMGLTPADFFPLMEADRPACDDAGPAGASGADGGERAA